jgi:hypothetical protein
MQINKKQLALGLFLALAIGYGVCSYVEYKKDDRPILTFVMKAARMGLWFMMFAEPPDVFDKNTIGASPSSDAPYLDHSRSL